MICLMHEAVPYGHLVIAGNCPTDAQLAVLVGVPADQLPDLIGELETHGVFSRTAKGVIYSRKLTRMAKKAAVSRKNGKNGGNPKLCKSRQNQDWDNPKDKPPDKPHIPYSRVQMKEKEEPGGSSKKKCASRLPDDWALPKDWGEFALSEGLDEVSVRREAEKFRDFWHGKSGKDATKADWLATWRNWIRNGIDRGTIRVRSDHKSNTPIPEHVRRLQAEHRAREAERRARQ